MTKRKMLEEHLEICPTWAPPDPRGTFLATAIAGEAGELLNLYKKEWRGDLSPDVIKNSKATHRSKVIGELADTVAYCLMLSEHLGIDIMHEVWEKMEAFEVRPEYSKLLRDARARR